jgi:hypothetical protein
MPIDDVAVDFPDMPIIMAHRHSWRDEAISVCCWPTVYIDLSGWSQYFSPTLIQCANTCSSTRCCSGPTAVDHAGSVARGLREDCDTRRGEAIILRERGEIVGARQTPN